LSGLAALVASLLLPPAARASCGAASCPIDTHAFNQPDPGSWSFDLSWQSIDQDEPRIGTRSAHVGEIPSEHDEVRTINRAATLAVRYALSKRWQVGVTVPWIDRFHEHIASGDHHDGEEPLEETAPAHAEATPAGHTTEHHEAGPERWSLEGAGDVALEAQTRVWSAGRSSLWLGGAVELPTGASDRANDDGEVAELPVQPGSDSTDVVLGLTYRAARLAETAREGMVGHTTALPFFLSASYRRNGKGRDDYRLGEEWQFNAGGAYPFGRRLEALLQLNARFRGKDSPGNTEEDTDFTGGTYLFVSPGLRVEASERWAGYAYVQIPAYQDVNQLQLTSKANWLLGLQARF
jgi:hypothetical protein